MMKTISNGARGPEVKKLQTALHIQPDGIFGPLTDEAVRDFQKSRGLVPDGIAGPKTWSALLSVPAMRTVDKIILHCTATPEGKDFTVEQIRAMHLQRGFSDIGYHWLVYRDGSVHPGRPENIAGAHCLGQNAHSIGVCYVGGCPPESDPDWKKKAKDTRTPAQKLALRTIVRELKKRYPGATMHGHYEFANKLCPSFKIEFL